MYLVLASFAYQIQSSLLTALKPNSCIFFIRDKIRTFFKFVISQVYFEGSMVIRFRFIISGLPLDII